MDKEDWLNNNLDIYTEEIQDIVTLVPSWIIRVGTSLILLILILIVVLSSVVNYPEIISVNLKVNSLNSPKAVFAKQAGKITALLVKEGESVKKDQPLAYMESTADHQDVLQLYRLLQNISEILKRKQEVHQFTLPDFNLGELQNDYQTFYTQYLDYVSVKEGGYYTKRKVFLQKDLVGFEKIEGQLKTQQMLQMKELHNKTEQFEAYKKLYAKKIISLSEYREQENIWLSSQLPLQTLETSILNNNTSHLAKEKEIYELEHTVNEQRSKFQQALESLITKTSAWINLHVLRSPVGGLITYAGIIQQDQTVLINQEIFMVNPSNTDFFGEIEIPQYNMGKIKIGQTALVRMKSFPFEQYGLLRGQVTFISDVAIKDSIFFAKVGFIRNQNIRSKIRLKNGMYANAQIVTEQTTILQRFLRNISSVIDK